MLRVGHWDAIGPLLLLLTVPSCGGSPVVLQSGQALASLVVGQDSIIALIVDPATCTSCDPVANKAIQIRTDNVGRLLIILSRQPTEVEPRRLIVTRVAIDGVLKRDSAATVRDT
jgi:hypothetical protein